MSQDFLTDSTEAMIHIVREYAKLSVLDRLTEQEAERLGEILETSTSDGILGFWIDEVDHFVGHYLKLLDEKSRNSYADQQALLREHIGVPTLPEPDRSDEYSKFQEL